MKIKKRLANLIVAAILLSAVFAGCNVGGEEMAEDASTKLTGKIYLVGDSTVCCFQDDYYLPRYGYGTQLYNFVNCDESQIVNLALSGRSSLSFLSEANYTALKNGLGAGDYLLIGFGHNDEKSDDPARFTSALGDKDTEGSFQNVLNEKYLKLAKERGATPVLCTPIVRYDETGSYSGAKTHITADGDYAQAIRNLGAETDTTVIDLTELTKSDYKNDNAAAKYYHAHTTYSLDGEEKVPDGRDDTHLNMYGAKKVAYLLTQALLKTNCPLKENIVTNAIEPTEAVDFPSAINAEYEKPDYKPFDPATATKLGTTATNTPADWYATVMGEVGGESKLKTYKIAYDGDTFTVGNEGGNGKFTDTQDGFGAAFVQIDRDKNFTARATVKVVSVGESATGQSAFGMMLRDDIYVNTYSSTINSNFVAAGILHKKGAIFSHENGKLSSPEYAKTEYKTVKAGDTFNVEITRLGQAVTVKVNTDEKTYTDFDFIAVDNGYMYLCLFSNRGIVVEFSNVEFEITSNSQGA